VTEKMLLEELEAQPHNSDINGRETENLQLWRKVKEGAVFVQQLRTEKETGNVARAQNRCARATVPRQFKQHATVARNNVSTDKFIWHLCFKLYFFVLKHFIYFAIYKIAWKLKNFNKSTVLTSIESVNRIMKKNVATIVLKNMGTNCTQFHKSRNFLLRNPRVNKIFLM
jgi:hypothetical protein